MSKTNRGIGHLFFCNTERYEASRKQLRITEKPCIDGDVYATGIRLTGPAKKKKTPSGVFRLLSANGTCGTENAYRPM